MAQDGMAQEDIAQPGDRVQQEGELAEAATRRAASAGPVPAAPAPTRVCLMRLKRYPGQADKARGAPPGGASSGLAMIKRSLRKDADELFAAFLSDKPARRLQRGAGRAPGDGPTGASPSAAPQAK
jgi:hypothetical protein